MVVVKCSVARRSHVLLSACAVSSRTGDHLISAAQPTLQDIRETSDF